MCGWGPGRASGRRVVHGGVPAWWGRGPGVAADGTGLDADVAIDVASVPGEVPRGVVETVGAAAAEALRNSVRHAAGAERVVGVVVSPGLIEVSVEDRGPGFDADRVDEQRLGIRGSILERMRSLPGGAAVVESRPGSGTRVVVTWRI